MPGVLARKGETCGEDEPIINTRMVEIRGLEPLTSALRTQRSTN